jgi:Protein of unknown function (DUF3082)
MDRITLSVTIFPLFPFPFPLFPIPMTQSTTETALPSPFRCLIGAVIAGVMSFAMYTMTSNIATTFATKPMGHKTTMAVNIAAAVRTLVVGSTALGTAVFGIIAVGLVALAVQVARSGTQDRQKIG